MRSAGPVLVLAGLLLALVGLAIWAGLFRWFGRLPGDIRIERDGVRLLLPLVSCLVLSVLASLLWALVRRWLS